MNTNLSSLVNNSSKIKDHEKCQDEETVKDLIKKCSNTHNFCKADINKFRLLLRKGVYPYDYMDSWKTFKEESLPDKEWFYRELNKEHITDEDYAHPKNYLINTAKIWEFITIYKFRQIHFCMQTFLKILEICAYKY